MLNAITIAACFAGIAACSGRLPQFSAVDQNNDGYLSREEANADPQVTKVFATADVDHDNLLSQTEYENVMAQAEG
jgi:hypothetical protein